MIKVIKKSLWLILITILFSNFSNTLVMAASDLPPVYSEGAILMDGITGEILYSKNEHVKYEPASTTKVMTALVVLENTNLSDKVTIGENPPLVDGSAIGIQKGEIYTVEELLTALLLESANDCAEALAEYVAGSNADFAVLMNNKALEIGAIDTTFKNPSGLHEDGHITTAYDLCLIMKEATQNEEYIRISQIYSYKFVNQPFSDGTEKWAINRNQLFNEYTNYLYEYAYSGKNGYTPEANHSYTASAIKDGQVLIAAFLNAEDKDNFYLNIGPLFDYGFENFETVKLISKGDILTSFDIEESESIDILSSDDVYYTKPRNSEDVSHSLKYNNLSESISKLEEINVGDFITTAIVNVNGKDIYSLNLESGSYYKKVTITDNFLFNDINLLTITLWGFIILIIIVIVSNVFLYLKRKKLRRKHPKFNRNR